MEIKKLVKYLDKLLKNEEISDISINGLQFEGKNEIKKIGLAVDACFLSYEKAVEKSCDMILVHHGILWGALQKINGPFKRQIEFLVKNDLNLYASHLPLDLHGEFGNNIELSRILGLKNVEDFGLYKGFSVGFSGELEKGKTNQEISDIFQEKIGGKSIILPFGLEKNKRIGIVSGGGSCAISEAIEKGFDCLITGEGSHENHHEALEGNLNVIYLGHYHSEKVGVIALGEHLKEKFGLEIEFLDVPTIV